MTSLNHRNESRVGNARPPSPLSIRWRGGQGVRSQAYPASNWVPPLHPMERGSGGEVRGVHIQNSRRNKKFFLRHVLVPGLIFLLTNLSFTALAQPSDDKQATFFMGRVRYSANDGNDCGGVGQDLIKLVSRASTLKIQEERKVRLTDPDLFETRYLFLNGT